MITPRTYGNAAMMLTNSSNQSSGYMTGNQTLSGSNIGGSRGNAGYSSFDLAAPARMSRGEASIYVGLWGLSRAAFPNNDNWTWIAVPT